MLFHSFCQGIFPILKHFNHEFELLVELADCVFLLLLQLLLDFADVVFEYFGLLQGHLDLFLKCILLLHQWINLIVLLHLKLIADLMALVLADHALGANVCLTSLAEILGLLLRMLEAELFYL